MAIINCPECNGKLSDTVQQCIHCGALIIVCQECKSAYVKGTKNCSACGFEFKTELKSSTTKTETEKDLQQESKVDKNKTPTAGQLHYDVRKYYSKLSFSDFIDIVIGGIPHLIYIGAIIRLVYWTDNLSTYESALSDITTLLLIAFGINVAITVFSIINKKQELQRCIDYTQNRKIDLLYSAEQTLNMNLSKMNTKQLKEQSSGMTAIINADIYSKKQSAQSAFTFWSIFKISCSAIGNLFLFLFLRHNIIVYMQTELSNHNGNFEIENWWMLAIVVATVVIKILYGVSVKKEAKNQRRNWVKEKLPNRLEIYDTYIYYRK